MRCQVLDDRSTCASPLPDLCQTFAWEVVYEQQHRPERRSEDDARRRAWDALGEIVAKRAVRDLMAERADSTD